MYRLDTTITQQQVIGVSTPPKIMVHVQERTSHTHMTYIDQNDKRELSTADTTR